MVSRPRRERRLEFRAEPGELIGLRNPVSVASLVIPSSEKRILLARVALSH